MKYTQIPVDVFEEIQLNAGILVDSFNPSTGEIGNLLGATTGGINFSDSVEYTDFGEDIDNCPKNTMELKRIDSRTVTIAGTFVTVSNSLVQKLIGAADIDPDNSTYIVPRNELENTDFLTLWWIGDYSDVNTGESAGFVAIKMMNALSTGGFAIQSTDKAKGQFAFEFTGHYSISSPDTVPYEVYVAKGTPSVVPSIVLDRHSATIKVGDTLNLVPTVIPSGQTVTWGSADSTKASVSSGTVTGAGVGNTIISAAITVEGVTYNDTCTIIVEAATTT